MPVALAPKSPLRSATNIVWVEGGSPLVFSERSFLLLSSTRKRNFLISLLEKPWLQVSFHPAPRYAPSFLSCIAFSISAFPLFVVLHRMLLLLQPTIIAQGLVLAARHHLPNPIRLIFCPCCSAGNIFTVPTGYNYAFKGIFPTVRALF